MDERGCVARAEGASRSESSREDGLLWCACPKSVRSLLARATQIREAYWKRSPSRARALDDGRSRGSYPCHIHRRTGENHRRGNGALGLRFQFLGYCGCGVLLSLRSHEVRLEEGGGMEQAQR